MAIHTNMNRTIFFVVPLLLDTSVTSMNTAALKSLFQEEKKAITNVSILAKKNSIDFGCFFLPVSSQRLRIDTAIYMHSLIHRNNTLRKNNVFPFSSPSFQFFRSFLRRPKVFRIRLLSSVSQPFVCSN